jgi:RNA polymerase sigma factor (sigma-70 family)
MTNKELNILFLEGLTTSKKFAKFNNYMYNQLRGVYIKNKLFVDNGVELFDDIFQDSIVKLLNTKDRYNPAKSAIKTYFSTIFYNNLIDYCRKDKVRRKYLSTLPKDSIVYIEEIN